MKQLEKKFDTNFEWAHYKRRAKIIRQRYEAPYSSGLIKYPLSGQYTFCNYEELALLVRTKFMTKNTCDFYEKLCKGILLK